MPAQATGAGISPSTAMPAAAVISGATPRISG